MIQVEKLNFGFPAKDLYNDISFTLEVGQHCALIGSNGTGKSTLVEMLIDCEKFNYDGKIIMDENCRIGYAGQFSVRDKATEKTVFEYLSSRFVIIQQHIAEVCEEMATATEDMEVALEKYQKLLDINEAMDGDNYESNIRKKLAEAGMSDLENISLSQISGGEYKLLQIMREMLLSPNLLVLDEPDVFLDFGNLNGLSRLINGYKGTLLVITHNRYLLNHCFDKVLHLENGDIQEFDGTYTEYRCEQLKQKLELKIQYTEEQEEIERTEVMVDILRTRASKMVNPVIGKSVNAKQSQLDRLLARQIKAPFIEIREPQICLPEVTVESQNTGTEPMSQVVDGEAPLFEDTSDTQKAPVLTVEGYQVAFDDDLLKDVSFELLPGEKVAIVGANGTGKTTLIRDILRNDNKAIKINEEIKYACLSQLQGEDTDEETTVYEALQEAGFANAEEMIPHLADYCLPEEILRQKIGELSGGEQNLLQIAIIANSGAELLILDEPTSHLDIYAQVALERAIAEYKGAVLMVSHDFYLVANSADYVLLVEDNTIRRMRTRKFRKMVYDKYFDSAYLETDRKKQELEAAITEGFKNNDFAAIEKLCNQLEEISR